MQIYGPFFLYASRIVLPWESLGSILLNKENELKYLQVFPLVGTVSYQVMQWRGGSVPEWGEAEG